MVLTMCGTEHPSAERTSLFWIYFLKLSITRQLSRRRRMKLLPYSVSHSVYCTNPHTLQEGDGRERGRYQPPEESSPDIH